MRSVLILAAIGAALAACAPIASRLPGSPPRTGVVVEIDASAPAASRMRVQIPSRGADAPVTLAARNDDVETWIAVDNISISLRRGVLVATRGLGHDLMGAGAENTLAALAGLAEGEYRRQMRYLTGDHRTTYLNAGCSMAAVATEAVGASRVQRHEETCVARDHRFTNVFWTDGTGRIVRSRQWVSPEVGYLVLGMAG